MTQPLTQAELRAALDALPDWELLDGKLYRDFRFVDFTAAFAFMTAVARLADQADHHPEWHNVYDRVQVWLTTHDAGGISTRDLDLARGMDRLALESAPPEANR